MPESSEKKDLKKSGFIFSNKLLIVVIVLVVAAGGYLFYRSTHAASIGNWKALLNLATCPYNSAGIPPTIQTGSSGTCVAFLGLMLFRGGADRSVNNGGSFDAKTMQYVRTFQQQNGLTVDGTMNAATWSKLSVCVIADANRNGKIEVSDLLSPWSTASVGWACKKL